MKTAYILAGHSNTDPGAVANGVKEADLTKGLRDQICGVLAEKGITYQRDNDAHNLTQVLKDLRSHEGDLILDIHFNASGDFKATGVEVLVPDRANREEIAFANKLCGTVAHTLGIRTRGVKSERDSARGRLAIMQPAGNNILLEVCFISNDTDLAAYEEYEGELAEVIADLVADFLK
jgi:N-acetylmuramoyl-L-alanine amidase